MSLKAEERVENLERLEHLALSRQSVYLPGSPCWGKPRPAAFVQNLQGRVLVHLFRKGLRVYGPPRQKP